MFKNLVQIKSFTKLSTPKFEMLVFNLKMKYIKKKNQVTVTYCLICASMSCFLPNVNLIPLCPTF